MTPLEEENFLIEAVAAMNASPCCAFSIMDYWTFDGFKKLRAAGEKELSLRTTLFPGIELRVEAPVDYRLNVHAIFPQDVPDQVLEDFKSNLRLDGPTSRPLSEHALISYARELDEGKAKLLGFAHPSQLDERQLLELGSKTAQVTSESFREAVRVAGPDCFVILPYGCSDGIEKLDWKKHPASDLRWLRLATMFESRSESMIATIQGNKTASNESFFDAFMGAIGGKGKPAVSGSDAHKLSDYGNSPNDKFTWIKAEPTFDGLRQTLVEPARVFVGKEPPGLARHRGQPTRNMTNVSVRRVPGAKIKEQWFDNDLPLNPDMIAIIGNKGSGKSALADILGLLGNSAQQQHFSFLNNRRFLSKRGNRGEHFMGALSWGSGKQSHRKLDATVDLQEAEAVKYIPQNFLESICDASNKDSTELFENELQDVIFSHIPLEDRLGCTSLAKLVQFRTEESHRKLEGLQNELRVTLEAIVELERQATPEYEKLLKNQLGDIVAEISAHEKTQPSEVTEPDAANQSPEAKVLAERSAHLAKQIDAKTQEIEKMRELQIQKKKSEADIKKARRQLELLEQQVAAAVIELETLVLPLGLTANKLLTFEIDTAPLDLALASVQTELSSIHRQLDPEQDPEGAAATLGALRKENAALDAKLAEPMKRYSEYKTELAAWIQKKARLVGDSSSPNTQNYVANQLGQLALLPTRLEELRTRRNEQCRRIHAVIVELGTEYADYYKPVQDFIAQHDFGTGDFKVAFDTALSAETLPERFFEIVARNVAGSFCGKTEGEKVLGSLIEGVDFSSPDAALSFAESVFEHLQRDHRGSQLASVNPESQLKTGKSVLTLNELIYGFDYLRPKYALTLNGKSLSELSPGERGMLLLVFYLLVDKDIRPLIIDQPEENLDNQTIFSVLVRALRSAKERRQIVLVTHNPNLAVCCDAEQIVVAQMHKQSGNRIEYLSGAIETRGINKALVDILEGTRPAFDNRDAKYFEA